MKELQLGHFSHDDFPVLGKGVWGVVHDLRDSTVLKLVKEDGGIGSGTQKILHEIDVLKTLALSGSPLVSRYVSHGFIPPNSALHREGYAIWLRSTKIEGQSFTIEKIKILEESVHAQIAKSLAEALHKFYAILIPSGVSRFLKPDGIFNCEYELTPDDRHRVDASLAVLSSQSEADLQPIHGDFNISNILFSSDFKVSGVLDFAETCLGAVEDDLCSLTSELPFLKDDILSHYREISGYHIDDKRLALAEIKRDMIGLVLCRYKLSRPEEALENQERLDKKLSAL
jgi:hypothetical protein